MPFFEQANEFQINGGRYIDVGNIFGNIYLGASGNEDPYQDIRRLVQKDEALNHYSIQSGTLEVPCFPKDLLLRNLQISRDSRPTSRGSCAFDLASRLSMLPGQSNEGFVEYDTIPVEELLTRGACYCARISRHGLIFLISKYFQYAAKEEAPAGTCISVVTTIGRFKFYEIDDRTLVHFDQDTRSSYVDLVKDYKLEDIIKAARGQYLINKAPDSTEFHWMDFLVENLEYNAVSNFCEAPDAVAYMIRETLDRWKAVKEFAAAMEEAMLAVIDELREPASFLSALRNLPPSSVADELPNLPVASAPERLAVSVYLFRFGNRRNMAESDFKQFHKTVLINVIGLTEAHKYYRSPRIDGSKLLETSKTRFLRIMQRFQNTAVEGGARSEIIQSELRDLLTSNPNNVALVVYQGFIANIARWNASKVLARAREAPPEWIRFIEVDDGDVYLG